MRLHSVFYNYMYNHLSPTGQSRFGWGIGKIDFDLDLKEQIVTRNKLKPEEVFNFNLTALIPLIPQTLDNTKLTRDEFMKKLEDFYPKNLTDEQLDSLEQFCFKLFDETTIAENWKV